MAKRGKALVEDIPIDQMKSLIYQYGGNITRIAKHLSTSRDSVYDYIDVELELKDDLEKARCRIGEYEVESGYEILDKLMKKVEEDPSNSFKAANLILTRGKISRYYTEPKSDIGVTGDLKVESVYYGDKKPDA